jgi:hypothetical protein
MIVGVAIGGAFFGAAGNVIQELGITSAPAQVGIHAVAIKYRQIKP